MKSLILIVLVLVTEGSYVFEGTCCSGWESFDNNCYNYVATLKTWAEAEKHCLSLGGNLASVHNDQTHEFLKKLGKSQTGSYARTWIGGSDAVEASTWLWSDGSEFDFKLWSPNQPDNTGGNERCLEMNYEDKHLWNDCWCGTRFNFVCQKAAALKLVKLGAK